MFNTTDKTHQSCQSVATSIVPFCDQSLQHIYCPPQLWSVNTICAHIGANSSCNIDIFWDRPCMAFPPALMQTHLYKQVHNIVRHTLRHDLPRHNTTLWSAEKEFSIYFLSHTSLQWRWCIELNPFWIEVLHDQLLLLFECNPDRLDSRKELDLPDQRICSSFQPSLWP